MSSRIAIDEHERSLMRSAQPILGVVELLQDALQWGALLRRIRGCPDRAELFDNEVHHSANKVLFGREVIVQGSDIDTCTGCDVARTQMLESPFGQELIG